MSFLTDKITDIGQPSELSIFSVPPNQVAIEKIYFSDCRPVSSYNTEDTPIEITIPGQGNEYIDLRRSRLYIKCRIVKADGTALAAKEKTGIVNIPLQSMWSQIDTYMNGKLISLNTSYYPWKAYQYSSWWTRRSIASSRLAKGQQTEYHIPHALRCSSPNGSISGRTYLYKRLARQAGFIYSRYSVSNASS